MVFLSKLGDLKKKRSTPKFKGIFRPKSEIQGFFFRPNTGDLLTKKKGLHRNSKGFSSRNQKLKGFFGRMLVISKKKKRSPPKFKRVFLAEIRNSRVCFRPKSETQGFFRPNAGDLQKKKDPDQNSKGFFRRNQKFKGFFGPNAGDLQQKKRSSPKFKVFSAEIKNSKGFSGRNQVISKK